MARKGSKPNNSLKPQGVKTIVQKISKKFEEKKNSLIIENDNSNELNPKLELYKMEKDIEKAWKELENLYKNEERVIKDLKQKLIQAETAKKNASNKQDNSNKLAADLDVQIKDYQNRKKGLDSEKLKLEKERGELLNLKADLEEKEIGIEAGLPNKFKAYQEKLSQFKSKIEKERDDLGKEYSEKYDELYKTIEEKRKELRIKERNLRRGQKILEEGEKDLEFMVQSRIIKEKEKFNLDLLEWEHKYEILEESYQQKVTEITALEYLKREFDGKTGKQILKELKELEKEKERIYNQLLESLGPEGKARLEALEKEAIVWMEKKREYLELIEQYRTKEHQFNLSEGELLRLREEKEQLDSQLKLAKAYKDELEAQIDQYIQKAQVKAVFENCSTMDVSDDLQRSRPNPDACPKLDKLVDDLQARLYYQKNERTKEPMCLYYSKDTLRLFLAGLAMSKLSLLQGLSGTGKTSLAREFVRAIGGGYTVVEVQSGWRDRQDLLGYYNTFEKKYYETDFLTGVYEALTPQYKNAPYFIILDEMNLSHPEHYFADFLSLIGNDAIEKNISFKQTPKGIIKDGKSGLPAKFEAKDKGLELPLGDNVWFIGTANHDETTLNFAPKTYDRSNVMEIVMERKPEDESLVKLGGNKFISFELMMEQFKKVEKEKEYKDGVIEVKKKLTGFSEFLKELEIGIGNRIMTQIDRFVPVYCAAGGTKEQALDHLLSSRVLREIKGSYTIDPDSLELFLEEINENEYPKSHQLISKELKRLKQS